MISFEQLKARWTERTAALSLKAPSALASKRGGDEATLYLYEPIGALLGGISAADVVRALGEIGSVKTLHVRLNSPGGDTAEATAILAAIERTGARIITHVDGLAASAASYLAVQGSERFIHRDAQLMVHNPWALTIGDYATHDRALAMLRQATDTYARAYSERTGQPVAKVREIMDAETYLDAQGALDLGFAMVVEGEESAKPQAKVPSPQTLARVEAARRAHERICAGQPARSTRASPARSESAVAK